MLVCKRLMRHCRDGKHRQMFQSSFPLLQRQRGISAQKRRRRQALSEDRKRDDGEADGNDLLALRNFGRKSKGQGKRHRPSQAAPKQDVLMFHSDAPRRACKQKAAGIEWLRERILKQPPLGRRCLCLLSLRHRLALPFSRTAQSLPSEPAWACVGATGFPLHPVPAAQ